MRYTDAPLAVEKAKANLRKVGIKYDGTTVAIPKVTNLGIRGWGFIDWLRTKCGVTVTRS